MKRRSCLAAALMLGLGAPAQADVCKWTDANGRPQFGDCRQAPTQGAAKVDIRPATGAEVVRRDGPPPAVPVPVPAPAASAPARKMTRFPPPGTPAPAGWTSTCEKLAQRIMDLPSGTPFQSESSQIQQGCPGIAYHCEFRYDQPQAHRCGPIVQTPGQSLVSRDYHGYPAGVPQPTYRDAAR